MCRMVMPLTDKLVLYTAKAFFKESKDHTKWRAMFVEWLDAHDANASKEEEKREYNRILVHLQAFKEAAAAAKAAANVVGNNVNNDEASGSTVRCEGDQHMRHNGALVHRHHLSCAQEALWCTTTHHFQH